jgi:hypothetical protein
MNEQDLRGYAVRGLTARLTELDEERSRILVLLEQWDAAPAPNLGRKIGSVARQRMQVDSRDVHAAVGGDTVVPAAAPEPDVARILPRRNRAQAGPPAPEPPPALPPMPRLIKARAS